MSISTVSSARAARMRFVDAEHRITLDELRQLAEERYGDLTKAVVDVARSIMFVGCDMHVDGEAMFLEQGSKQDDLWGINIKPDFPYEEQIEFDSMINLRPWQENRSRGVEDPAVRTRILAIVRALIA